MQYICSLLGDIFVTLLCLSLISSVFFSNQKIQQGIVCILEGFHFVTVYK